MPVSKTIFIDTNYFCGINNKKDTLHIKCKKVFLELKKLEHQLYTSNFVIAESLTVLSQRIGKKIALKFGKDIFGSQNPIKILRTDKNLELASFEIFQKISSKNVSFVDASNIALMQKYKIDYLLTFDEQLLKIAGELGIKTLKQFAT